MMMKQLIKSSLKRFGIIAFKRSSRVYLPEEESYRVVAELVGRPDPVVVDGGAHLGDMVEKFGTLLPQAEFHCFEPDPDLGGALSRRYAGNHKVNVVQAALGEQVGKASFNINASRPTNSLLDAADDLQADLKKLCDRVRQVEVAVTTIDEYCASRAIDRIDAIKLDLQGYDYLALKGAGRTLGTARVVLVEVLFREFYKGCHLFPDTLAFMHSKGFELYTLCGLHYGERDQLLWADAIFVRSDNRSRAGNASTVIDQCRTPDLHAV